MCIVKYEMIIDRDDIRICVDDDYNIDEKTLNALRSFQEQVNIEEYLTAIAKCLPSVVDNDWELRVCPNTPDGRFAVHIMKRWYLTDDDQ